MHFSPFRFLTILFCQIWFVGFVFLVLCYICFLYVCGGYLKGGNWRLLRRHACYFRILRLKKWLTSEDNGFGLRVKCLAHNPLVRQPSDFSIGRSRTAIIRGLLLPGLEQFFSSFSSSYSSFCFICNMNNKLLSIFASCVYVYRYINARVVYYFM